MNMQEERGKSLSTYMAILVVLVIINTILARFGVIAYPIGHGSSGLYFAVAFMIVFALWFGGWGVIAAYIGCFIGAGVLSGMPLNVNLYWSIADIWQVLIPLAVFKAFNADAGHRTFKKLGYLLKSIGPEGDPGKGSRSC